jgi:hypothetical protein
MVLDSSGKLRRWYERLCGYKKAGLVRTGLRRRVLAELYQMLKKGGTIMTGMRVIMRGRWRPAAVFRKGKKSRRM